MPYPKATEEDVASFWEHGFIVVRDAIDPVELDTLIAHCEEILERKTRWHSTGRGREAPRARSASFQIVQSSPTPIGAELGSGRSDSGRPSIATRRCCASRSSSGTTSSSRSRQARARRRRGTRTKAYWGRNLDERGITCWMPLHDVDGERLHALHPRRPQARRAAAPPPRQRAERPAHLRYRGRGNRGGVPDRARRA